MLSDRKKDLNKSKLLSKFLKNFKDLSRKTKKKLAPCPTLQMLKSIVQSKSRISKRGQLGKELLSTVLC